MCENNKLRQWDSVWHHLTAKYRTREQLAHRSSDFSNILFLKQFSKVTAVLA